MNTLLVCSWEFYSIWISLVRLFLYFRFVSFLIYFLLATFFFCNITFFYLYKLFLCVSFYFVFTRFTCAWVRVCMFMSSYLVSKFCDKLAFFYILEWIQVLFTRLLDKRRNEINQCKNKKILKLIGDKGEEKNQKCLFEYQKFSCVSLRFQKFIYFRLQY